MDSAGEPLCLIQEWPVNRYDRFGQVISNTMPNELSVDEFYNTDELLFLKDDCCGLWDGPKADLDTLPPNYYRYELLINRSFDRKIYKNKYSRYPEAKEIKFTESYTVQIYWPRGVPTHIDLSPFVNSCSPWYGMLKDFEYFKKGRISYIDKSRSDSQCIVWPHGQYVRLDETKMNQNHKDLRLPGIKSIRTVAKYGNWICWEKI